MIAIRKGIQKTILNRASPDQAQDQAEEPAPGQSAATSRFHALAARLAAHPDLRVSVITCQDGTQELEVLGTGPPHHDENTIHAAKFARQTPATASQILCLAGQSGIQNAVNTIRAILMQASTPWHRTTRTNPHTSQAKATTWYQRTFHGRADQVSHVRREVARHLGDCAATDSAVLIASELASNSVMHSQSQGDFFTVRCKTYPGYIWVEVEDLGGPWQRKPFSGRPHGLDIVEDLTGPDNWGAELTSDGDRIVWARLELP